VCTGQAIDGPYLKVRDLDGFLQSAASSAALGYDGKRVLRPHQIATANEAFAPSQADFSRASRRGHAGRDLRNVSMAQVPANYAPRL
jgi:citrate lyase subunit beta/citryl-CoA lyase